MQIKLTDFAKWLDGQISMGIYLQWEDDFLLRFVEQRIAHQSPKPSQVVIRSNEVAVSYRHAWTDFYKPDMLLAILIRRLPRKATASELRKAIREILTAHETSLQSEL